MANFFRKQYDDIKGNMKWAALAILWAPTVELAKKLLHMIPNMPEWGIWLSLFLFSLVAFVWLAKHGKRTAPPIQDSGSTAFASQPPAIAPGIPSISALRGKKPEITFDAQVFFKQSYYSPMTAEVENNIKIAAQNNSPADHEAFYARFIGVGLVSFLHNETWHTIFQSQIQMLQRMIRNNGWMTLDDAKKWYENAVKKYPKMYENYAFEHGWLLRKTSSLSFSIQLIC
jgi:hypothetical protein